MSAADGADMVMSFCWRYGIFFFELCACTADSVRLLVLWRHPFRFNFWFGICFSSFACPREELEKTEGCGQ